MELNSTRSKTMLWASLVSDFEVLLTNFLASGRWDYKTFASMMKEFHTTSVFHAAIGKGKNRELHYDAVVTLILNTAKGFWLCGTTSLREVLKDAMSTGKVTSIYPFSCAIGGGTAHGVNVERREEGMNMAEFKKRLGAFYLLYTLFFKQPHAFANLIPMMVEDFEDVEQFEKTFQEVFPKNHANWVAYKFMLHRLTLNKAFEPTVADDKHDLEHPTRFFLNAKNDSQVELLRVLKQLQDELTHHQSIRAAKVKMTEYLEVKAELMKGNDDGIKLTGRKRDAQGIKKEEPEPCLQSDLRRTTTAILTNMKEVMSTVKQLGDTPVFSRSALLGNESTERLLISEAGKRKTRVENKETKAGTAQRYDRDIFGSQKVSNENEDDEIDTTKNSRRGRSQAASNLWSHYIPEQFDFS